MTKRRTGNKRVRRSTKQAGTEIIRGLTGLRDALAAGEDLPARFTVREVPSVAEPQEWRSGRIVALRQQLSVSQGVFAKLLGTSVKTVQAWEQGGTPPPMARRLLDCIKADPRPWKRLLTSSAAA